MTHLKLFSSALLVITSLQLAACQAEKKDVISDATHQNVLKLEEERHAFEVEGVLRHFAFEEYHLMSGLSGEATPENFKALEPLPSALYHSLDFDKSSISYVKFVKELNIGCNGGISYVQFAEKVEISFDNLIHQEKWRALHLKMCGSLTVPEGKKLIIDVKDSSFLQDFDVTTSQHSLFSLTTTNTTYVGEEPKITITSPSVLKIHFF